MKLGNARNLLGCAALAVLLGATSQLSAQVIVDEDFDSYANTGALNAVWTPDDGEGANPIGLAGELIPTTNTTDYAAPYDNPPGLMGQGVGNFSDINEYNGSAFAELPTASKNIVLRGDIFVDDDGSVDPTDGLPNINTRQTIGLRNDTFDRDPTFGIQRGLNFLEMGFYNASTCDPTVVGCDTSGSAERIRPDPDAEPPEPGTPGYRDSSQFGYRLVIFGSYGDFSENGVNKGPLEAAAPNWQYFQLNPALDLSTTVLPNGNSGNEDGLVNITDVGSGWHEYQATLSEDSILLELDLFRDGLDNATGLAGIDASVEIGISYADAPEIPGQQTAQPAPFTSLRIGAPSGIQSTNGDGTVNFPSVFDNIYLALEDVATVLVGDYNGNGVVDAADYTVWRDTLGDSVTPGTGADGDGDGNIDPDDYNLWVTNFGNSSPSNSASVPEPGTLALLLAAAGVMACKRR